MDCNECSDILSLYILNELPQSEADEVAKHLTECEGCSKQVKELSALLTRMTSLEEVEPPEDFLKKVTQKAELELWTGKGKVLNLILCLKIASIAAVFVVSIIAFRELDSFRIKSTADMAMSSTASARSSNGNASGATDKDSVSNQTTGKAENSTMALQDSKLAQAPQNSSEPKVAYDINSDAVKNSKASESITAEKEITPSAAPAPEKSNADIMHSTDSRIMAASNDTPASEPKAPETSPKPEDVKSQDELRTAKTLAGGNQVAVSSILSDGQAETQIQIKAKDKAAATQWVREQARKLNGTEVTAVATTASSLTTQESTYAAAKAITRDSIASDGDKIIIDVSDVSKDNATNFKSSILEYFGKDNVVIEENDISSDTVRFVILINE